MAKRKDKKPKFVNKPKTKEQDLGALFKQQLIDVANEVGKLPREVTIAEYNTECDLPLGEWQLRTLGGFKAAKNFFYPPEKNPIISEATKAVRGYKNKVESQIGREIFLADEIVSVLKDVLKANPIKLHAPVKAVKKSGDKKSERVLVAHLSDLHYGTNVSKDELDGINEFSWTIAARRTALMMDQIVTYKPQYRDNTKLVMAINGDILAGVIHNQEWAVDVLTTQFAGALSILSQAISYAASHFKEVEVVCTVGNHGRAMHKSSHQRATVHKWDAYENMLYVAMRETLKAHKNVSFTIPESPYAVVDVLGHSILVTHGDTVIAAGNPGNKIDIKGISEQINSFNASDAMVRRGKKIEVVMLGHLHTPLAMLLETGIMLLVNGCLVGADGFAQSIGITSSAPTQQLFEVTKSHAVGDLRMIQVKEADEESRFDAIIAPFKAKF